MKRFQLYFLMGATAIIIALIMLFANVFANPMAVLATILIVGAPAVCIFSVIGADIP